MSPVRDRLAAAEVRACDAYRSITRAANNLLEELEETTDVGTGIPRHELDDADSAVIVVQEAIDDHKRVATR